MPNVSPNPTVEFDTGQLRPPDNLQALMHSHPDGQRYPTQTDMVSQVATGVPWGIIPVWRDGATTGPETWFGDQCPVPALVGREFLSGVTDCYGLVRDYYRLKRDHVLPMFPRENRWWKRGGDMLSAAQCLKTGFRQIHQDDIRTGDMVLFQIRCAVANHCGIYLGEHLILHHLYNRLSRRDSANAWLRMQNSCWRLE